MSKRHDALHPKSHMNLPAELLDAFDAEGGQGVVAFVGSGPSCDAGLPNWANLLEHVAMDVGLYEEVKPHIRSGRLIEVAQFLSMERSERAIQERVANEIKRASAGPGRLHRLIVGLPFDGIITTNYDLLLIEADAARRFQIPITYKTSGLSEHIHQRFVLHLHGHINDTETIILSRQSYDHILLDNDRVRHFVNAVFQTRRVLFIGFGFIDPNVDTILRDLSHLKVIGASSVFALVPCGKTVDRVVDASLRYRSINPIYVRDRGDHGTGELCEWLGHLAGTLHRIAEPKANSARKLRSDDVTNQIGDLLVSDEWLPLFGEAVLMLRDRPDLTRLTRPGLRRQDVDRIFARLSLDEMRSILVFVCNKRRHAVLEDALSCFPPF
jgi:hypothetical protein